MLSYITPPVALAAMTAAVIAQSDQMKTAFMAMRLGSIKFVLPFIMVLTPALIMRGEPLEIVISITTCTIAVIIMAMGFEGYLYGVGRVGWSSRILLLVGAAGFLYPDPISYGAGAIAVMAIYGGHFIVARRRPGLS